MLGGDALFCFHLVKHKQYNASNTAATSLSCDMNHYWTNWQNLFWVTCICGNKDQN